MGSVGNPNPWAPYDTYKDCSQGICSIYCPQWCYIIFPPPPPDYYADDNSATDFSPLIIAVIGILVSAFLLVSYYTIISKYCRRRGNEETGTELDEHRAQIMNSENWQASSDGLDEALVKSITVCKYKKNDGLVEGTDCAVCLSEFQENESLRLLPKCNHAFHLPCIDTWLKSHSSCPLCRANIASTANSAFHQTPSVQEIATDINISALEHRSRTDAILVVEDLESGVREGAAVVSVEIQPFRRSASLNSLCAERPVLIADILRHGEDEDDGEFDVGNLGFLVGIGSSKEFGKQNERMKRSVSTGRFVFPRCGGRGRNCIIPN